MTHTSLLGTLSRGHSPYDRCLNGGGGKGAAPAPMPQVTPPPPTEEASVQVDTEGMKKKVSQGKAELKVPTTIAETVGLKV